MRGLRSRRIYATEKSQHFPGAALFFRKLT